LQELTEVQEDLTLEKLISDEQYDQNKDFKTQLNKIIDENAGLKSQLEKIKEDTKNQLETLSASKAYAMSKKEVNYCKNN
jgi:regulator of replication initiation timing